MMCALCAFKPNSHLYRYKKGLNDLNLENDFSHNSPSCEYKETNNGWISALSKFPTHWLFCLNLYI